MKIHRGSEQKRKKEPQQKQQIAWANKGQIGDSSVDRFQGSEQACGFTDQDDDP